MCTEFRLVRGAGGFSVGAMKCVVIGCGKMGTALVGGAIRAGALSADQVTGCDPYPAAAAAFAETTGAKTISDAAFAVADADAILLCVKPHDAANVIASLAAKDSESKLLISVVAGVSLAALEAAAPASWRVIRSMPNTPALVGKGATAFCRGGHASDADAVFAMELFSSVGLAIEVPERLMNAVTGLSGSGPAYGFLCIEALADGGVAAGLPRDHAMKLAAQTLLGAAAMVGETGMHPGALKDAVASPGGTTIAGIEALENGGLRAALISAVTAAAKRAGELGGQ
jgi:pyrroline-5-carboxylate reductase